MNMILKKKLGRITENPSPALLFDLSCDIKTHLLNKYDKETEKKESRFVSLLVAVANTSTSILFLLVN